MFYVGTVPRSPATRKRFYCLHSGTINLIMVLPQTTTDKHTMATIIRNLRKDQRQALISAFGYEHYDNGNGGHPRIAEKWLKVRGFTDYTVEYRGCPVSERVIKFNRKIWFLPHHLKELRAIAAHSKAKGTFKLDADGLLVIIPLVEVAS